MKEEIFALDIGTRKVMGIVSSRHEDFLEIIDVETIEHPTRAMFDGQIHSIDEVARTVNKIKNRLETRLNKKLQKVGVAVAGRNLLTYKIKVAREFSIAEEVTQALVRDLELEAVDKIVFDAGKDLSEFYCVGYSPICYELDGNRITNAVGHRAKMITTEVIVTFLPRMVLDSIFAVLKKVGLCAINITLEPISAINAIIPLEMRNLNIILVDIGAGTSDLALAKDGVVFAYGMVAEAGDEITDFISENLLADFSTAETIKRSLDKEKEIEYEDIWSRRRRIDVETLKTLLSPAVKKLSASIAKTGLDLNGGIPQAVVCVGGGSLTPNLIEELALSFGLPLYKVGIRLPSVMKSLKDKTGKLNGPEAVTPIGIALMTEKAQGLRFIDVEVAGKKVTMLDFQQKKDVMGALTLSGIINGKKLYPRPGLALTVKVNQELKIIKGTLGVPAKITLNAKAIDSLSDKIEDGDKLEFTEAIDGRDAQARVSDLVKIKPTQVILNGEALEIMPSVTINGQELFSDNYVCDRDIIEVLPLTVKDVLRSKDIKLENLSERQILVNINAVPKILTQRNFTLLLNSKTSELSTEVKADDAVEFSSETPTFYRISDVVDMPSGFQKMHINVDDKDIEVVLDTVQVFMNGHQVNPGEFLIDGADIRVYHVKERKILLSEIFKYIEVDPQKVLGKRIRILVDDNPAGFTTPLVEGSKVRILFEDRNNGL
jgi:cell division protein FtsA